MASTKWFLPHQKLLIASDFGPIQLPKITLGGQKPFFLIEKMKKYS
jgi:hypothetical protein